MAVELNEELVMRTPSNAYDLTGISVETEANRGIGVFILRCIGVFPLAATALFGAMAVRADLGFSEDWAGPRGSP